MDEAIRKDPVAALVQVGGRHHHHLLPHQALLIDGGALGALGEDRRVVVGVHHRDVHCGVVGEGRAATVLGLHGQEVLLGSLVVDFPCYGHKTSVSLDHELPSLIAADDGVGDLCVDPGVPGAGHQLDDIGADRLALPDARKVVLACKLGRIVVDVCK